MALIAQYLLHLAANPEQQARHNDSQDDAEQQMIDFGLSEEQRAIVRTGDRAQISQACDAELPSVTDPDKTFTFTIDPTVFPHG
jgi:hypothetical protein